MGVVFNITEQIVTEEHGADTWDDLLAAAGVTGAYTSIGNYDDAELAAIVRAAAQTLGVAPPDVLRHVGRRALPLFLARYPSLRGAETTSRGLLMTLNSVIHPEVRKLYPGADVPDFDFVTQDPAELAMTYRSTRRLCHLAEGLVLGTGDEFGESLSVTQPLCMHDGDDHCVLVVRWWQ